LPLAGSTVGQEPDAAFVVKGSRVLTEYVGKFGFSEFMANPRPTEFFL
jgi:hypothetical protein